MGVDNITVGTGVHVELTEERVAAVRRHPSARHKTEDELRPVIWQQMALVQIDGSQVEGFVDDEPMKLRRVQSARRVRELRQQLHAVS